MPKVLVLFHSRTDNTAALAEAIAEGAASVKFTEVEIRRVEELVPAAAIEADGAARDIRAALERKYRPLESVESLTQYDALVVGSPVRHGMVSGEMKRLLDEAGRLATGGALADKVGSAFGSVPAAGGEEMNLMPMLIPMMGFGMIIVPPARGDQAAVAAGDLAAARRQGARVAKVAEWVRHAKSHEAHGHRH